MSPRPGRGQPDRQWTWAGAATRSATLEEKSVLANSPRTLDHRPTRFQWCQLRYPSRKPCTEAAPEGPARRLRPDEITAPSHLDRVSRARARPPVANGRFSAMRAAASGGCVTQRRDPAIPQESNQCSNFSRTLRRLRATYRRGRARISRSKQQGQGQCAS